MFKSTVRNMLSRKFRGRAGASTKGFSLKETRKTMAAQRHRKREQQLKTESELVDALGEGATFSLNIARQYRHEFDEQNRNPKRCSAFLNHVAKSRMLDGKLWTDEAVSSVFRRSRMVKREMK